MQHPRADDLWAQAGLSEHRYPSPYQVVKVENCSSMDNPSERGHGIAEFREEPGHGCKITYITGNDSYCGAQAFNGLDLPDRFVRIIFFAEARPKCERFRQSATTHKHQVSRSPLRHPMSRSLSPSLPKPPVIKYAPSGAKIRTCGAGQAICDFALSAVTKRQRTNRGT